MNVSITFPVTKGDSKGSVSLSIVFGTNVIIAAGEDERCAKAILAIKLRDILGDGIAFTIGDDSEEVEKELRSLSDAQLVSVARQCSVPVYKDRERTIRLLANLANE